MSTIVYEHVKKRSKDAIKLALQSYPGVVVSQGAGLEQVEFNGDWTAESAKCFIEDILGHTVEDSQIIDKTRKSLFQLISKDEAEMKVFGWLYVTHNKAGEQMIDHSGEIISPETLEKAAYEFVAEGGDMGANHQKLGVGYLIEAMVFTQEKKAALGIPDGILPTGLWVGLQMTDRAEWKKVISGEYKMLSLGGLARKIERQIHG